MKKIFRKSICIIIALSVLLVLSTGCDSEGTSTVSEPESIFAVIETSSNNSSNGNSSNGNSSNSLFGLSFDDLLDDDDISYDLGLEDVVLIMNLMTGDINDEDIEMSFSTRGKSMVINYTLKFDGADKEIAQMFLDEVDDPHAELLDDIRDAGIQCNSIIAEFKDKKGTLLLSKEYK
jgi:hypothetical protein